MRTIGTWIGEGAVPAFEQTDLLAAAQELRSLVHVVQDPARGGLGVARGGQCIPEGMQAPGGAPAWPLLATLPPIYPEWLGDR
ncbi:MAG: 2-nitropropane dioxygenase, partial [Deltaproteobacteria bacterium]|nr:2-nitropropane dioxygenase [Deltaproteobacteria bacterium]